MHARTALSQCTCNQLQPYQTQRYNVLQPDEVSRELAEVLYFSTTRQVRVGLYSKYPSSLTLRALTDQEAQQHASPPAIVFRLLVKPQKVHKLDQPYK